ncbi:hypothetical protein JCM10207_005192 [Rhodosporidiobolus poonsookiae]
MLGLVLTGIALALLIPYLLRLARPGFISLFEPYSVLPGVLAQCCPRFVITRKGLWINKADLYEQHNSTVLLVPSIFPPTVTALVGDGKLIHQINDDRKTYTKPEGSNARVLWYYGHNLLSSEGLDWRRHRRVSVSSFSEANTKQVWRETVRFVEMWQEKLEKDKGEDGKTEVKSAEDAFAILTLLIIGETAFGVHFPWPSSLSQAPESNSNLSFFQLTKIILREFLPVALLPAWAMHLPHATLRRVRTAYEQFEEQLRAMIETRRGEIERGEADEKHDLLTALVRANMREEGKNKLSDQELLSDAYIFVVAGHETSSNALATLFALFALYPSHQDVLHAEIASYLAADPHKTFTYPEAYAALPQTLAAIQEGLRLAGPVAASNKFTATEVVLDAKTMGGEPRKVVVPAGSWIKENVTGAHYSPLEWDDPCDFRPSRFLEKDWPRESWLPFSSGLRGCIGKQFALVEMVAIVALTMYKYRLEVPEGKKAAWALREGETERKRRERVFQSTWPVTLAPQGIDLVFAPRKGQPGFITLFEPYSMIPGILAPLSRRIVITRKGMWMHKADWYIEHDSTVLVVVSLFPPMVHALVGDGKLIHQINDDRKTFTKVEESKARVLWLYGHNLLTSVGEEWRRRRRVSVASFSEANTKKVWAETVRLVGMWQEKLEEAKGEDGKTVVKEVEDVLAVLTLLVIGETGFGVNFPWPASPSPIHELTRASSLVEVTQAVHEGVLPVAILPPWAMNLPFKPLQRTKFAFEQFEARLRGLIEMRRREIERGEADDTHDLLTALVRANMREEGKNKLSDQDLLSNVYIFLLAGHETSANALATLFALLALYPSHQDVLYDEVSGYLDSDPSRPFAYPVAYAALPQTLAVIQEGLRLAGPVTANNKVSTEDTVLDARNNKGEVKKVFLPAGTWIKQNVSGAHYSELEWDDPYDFRPSRFLEKDWPRESWLPFSSGLRGCIGKQFALVEMVAIVALTMHKYRLEVPEGKKAAWALREGETERARRERVFQGAWLVTLTPQDIDLVFIPRKKAA